MVISDVMGVEKSKIFVPSLSKLQTCKVYSSVGSTAGGVTVFPFSTSSLDISFPSWSIKVTLTFSTGGVGLHAARSMTTRQIVKMSFLFFICVFPYSLLGIH